jgi:predicted enzyme related to lactoylglutathione lyase
MNRVVHFEIHAKDMDKVQKFYQDVFGWNIQDMGPQMGNYRLINTGTDTAGSQWNGINGGMNPRQGDSPQAGTAVNAFVCTISVESIDETLAKIEKAGGTVATDKMDVPGVGILAYRKDPDGNIFGVLQPAQM